MLVQVHCCERCKSGKCIFVLHLTILFLCHKRIMVSSPLALFRRSFQWLFKVKHERPFQSNYLKPSIQFQETSYKTLNKQDYLKKSKKFRQDLNWKANNFRVNFHLYLPWVHASSHIIQIMDISIRLSKVKGRLMHVRYVIMVGGTSDNLLLQDKLSKKIKAEQQDCHCSYDCCNLINVFLTSHNISWHK